ncbi:MAG: BatD family protein [Fidelibacterota bacterium]
MLYAPKQPSFRDTQVEGVRYRVATVYEIALFPTSHGDLSVDPMIIDCTVKLPSRTRFPSLFDEFFSDPFSSRTRQKTVHSAPLEFHVNPVPQEGRPEDYTGAVGQFSLAAHLDTNVTTVNEAVAYTLELKGTGNLSLFQVAEPSFPADLDVFEPKTSFKKDPFRDEISGTKTWEYILIPRKQGRYFLPETELVYFDPNSARWVRESAPVEPLTVQAGDRLLGRGEGLTKEEIALLGQDIRYIRTRPVRLEPVDRPFVAPAFWLLTVAALMLFAAPGTVRAIRSSRQERSGVIRSRGALKSARKELKRIQDPQSYSRISRTVFHYLSDRLGVSPSGLDAREVRKLLDGKVSGETVEKLTRVLAVCDEARYAPSSAAGKGKSAVDLAREVSELLEAMDPRL